MSQSPINCGGDTIPNTPEPSSNQGCIFARLLPVNSAARQNFDHAVDAIKENPTLFAHARQNMCIEPARQASLSAASVFTDTDASDNEAASADASYRFKGGYLFQLSRPPRSKAWILGDGRGSTAGRIDFLLTGPRRAAEVAGIHAMIFPHQRSCRLVLGARHKTIVPSPIAGGTTLTLTKGTEPSEVELAYENEIRIGPCVYLFQYDEIVESKEHQEQVSAFMRRVHGADWEGLPNILGASPDVTPVRLHGYTWSLGAFARGTFGQVTAGTRSNGDVIAVKRLLNPNEERLSAHRRLMAHVGKHPNIIQLLDCYAGPDAVVPEAYNNVIKIYLYKVI